MNIDELAGIPGDIAATVKAVRFIRFGEDAMGRYYTAELPDGHLRAIVSRDAAGKNGRLLWHISVSHADKDGKADRLPTWDELKVARYRLIEADVPMILIFPRRSAPYVNVAKGCLHLWQSEKEIDT